MSNRWKRNWRWNQTAVLNKLSEAGALHATEGDQHTKKVMVEGVQHRMVCVKWSALLPEDDGGAAPESVN